MSYCRFSSDDYRCDVYCYADALGGFTTHVASKRVVLQEPLPDPVLLEPDSTLQWLKRQSVVGEIVAKSPLVQIGLPCDGKTFQDPTIKH